MNNLKAVYAYNTDEVEVVNARAEGNEYYLKSEVDKEIRKMKRSLWLMTAEWAEAMGLASCNIANKFMSRGNFEVSDDYRNNTVKKYRHRQVVFYKYAEYCRKKSEAKQ